MQYFEIGLRNVQLCNCYFQVLFLSFNCIQQPAIPNVQNAIEMDFNHHEMQESGLSFQQHHNNREHPQHQQDEQHQPHQEQHELSAQQKEIKLPANFRSRYSNKLFFMISVIVIVFMFVTFLFRSGQNHLNPIAFIFHFSSFLLTPLIIIWQNQNLKSYAVTTFGELSNCSFITSFFNTPNQIYPIVV